MRSILSTTHTGGDSDEAAPHHTCRQGAHASTGLKGLAQGTFTATWEGWTGFVLLGLRDSSVGLWRPASFRSSRRPRAQRAHRHKL